MPSPDASNPFARPLKPRAQSPVQPAGNSYSAGDIIEYVARSADHHCLVTIWHTYEQRKRSPEYVTRRDVMISPEFLTFASLLVKARPQGDDLRYNLRALDLAIFMYRNSPASVTNNVLTSVYEALAIVQP